MTHNYRTRIYENYAINFQDAPETFGEDATWHRGGGIAITCAGTGRRQGGEDCRSRLGALRVCPNHAIRHFVQFE